MKRNSCRFFSSSLFQKTKSFTRVVDGFFFPNDPLDLLAQKSFKPVPSIIGVNNPECGFLLPMVRIPAVPPSAPSAVRQLFASHWVLPEISPSYEGWSPSPKYAAWAYFSSFLSLKEENCGLGAAVASVHPAPRIGLKKQLYKKIREDWTHLNFVQNITNDCFK